MGCRDFLQLFISADEMKEHFNWFWAHLSCWKFPPKQQQHTDQIQKKTWRGRKGVVVSSASANIQGPHPLIHPLSQPQRIVDFDDTPHHVTIHILLLCSMFHDNKVRRTAEVRLSSCFLGWKFQPLRAICLYVHWRIWEPSIRLLALQLLGPSQPSLPPACSPACLLAGLLACLLGWLLSAPASTQWERLLHFVSHRMGWFD